MARIFNSRILLGLFTFALAIPMAIPLAAQDDHISFKASVKKDSSETSNFILSVDVEIADGWHAYASVPEGNPSPITKVQFQLPDGVTAAGEMIIPKGTVYFEDPEIEIYEGEVNFQQAVSAKNNEPVEIGVQVTYQICTKDRCLPPSTWKGSVELPASTEVPSSKVTEFESEIFEAPTRLMVDDVPLNKAAGQMYPSPAMFDVDNDGKVELVVGDIFGSLNVYENISKDNSAPAWASHEALNSCEGEPIKVSNW